MTAAPTAPAPAVPEPPASGLVSKVVIVVVRVVVALLWIRGGEGDFRQVAVVERAAGSGEGVVRDS